MKIQEPLSTHTSSGSKSNKALMLKDAMKRCFELIQGVFLHIR